MASMTAAAATSSATAAHVPLRHCRRVICPSRSTGPSGPAPVPGLHHQRAPQRILAIAPSGLVLRQALTHRSGIEEARLPQAALAQEILRPFPERPAQPGVDGNAEPHLRPLHE